jgi:hypothetical protein
MGKTFDHGQGAAQQIADPVGQVAVDAGHERGAGKVAVLAERHFPEQEVSKGVGAELVHHFIRIDHVAAALRHLFTVHRPPAVREDGLGRWRSNAISIVDQ